MLKSPVPARSLIAKSLPPSPGLSPLSGQPVSETAANTIHKPRARIDYSLCREVTTSRRERKAATITLASPSSGCYVRGAMGKRPRIVLADDEQNLRKVLGAILLREGYEVLEAADGE